MNLDQQDSLRRLGTGFTTDEALAALDWTDSRTALFRALKALGYETIAQPEGQARLQRVWIAPPLDRARGSCTCRCHTGTCGENAMVLAERAIRLIERIRPIGADGINAIVAIVDSAGVDFARAALGIDDLDDDVPF